MSVNAGTQHIREMIRDLIDAESTTGRSGEVADQILSLLPTLQDLPTLEQVQEMISVAYRLGWRDREAMTVLQRKLIPPTVTIVTNSDGSWTFLYDGKPRS